jgi:hypothetical protein
MTVHADTAGRVVTAGAAAVAGATVMAGAVSGHKKRSQAAGVELWNSIAQADDPTTLNEGLAGSINERFGGSADAHAGIKQAYSAYLQARSLCCCVHTLL